jgi:mycoredoxin
MKDKQIKMYGTTWCPDCARAKRLLEQKGIPYIWINIEEDDAAREYIKKVNNGYQSVPTILFPDGSVLVEPGKSELEKKLAVLD